jgi:hypothetical protein
MISIHVLDFTVPWNVSEREGKDVVVAAQQRVPTLTPIPMIL